MRNAGDTTEWWFVRRGFPQAIADYTARQDVWTRAWPFLLFVMLIELFTSFGDRFDGWAQLGVFVAGAGVLVGTFVTVNLVRGRRAFRLPDDIGVFELAAFVIAPAALPLWFSDRGWSGSALLVGVNLAVLGAAYLITSYGLVPALRVGVVQAFRQLRTVIQLVARGLPLLLLITAFVFLNAEMWQVAHDFSPAFFGISVGFMVLLALAFLALRVPKEINELARFDSWQTCCDLVRCTDAPIAQHLPVLDGRPPDPDLTRVELVNVGILLTISQAVQTLLVGTIAGVFYVGFGLLAVRRDTVLQWTTATELNPLVEFGLFGDQVVLTWEHLAVSGFIAAFSVLQFAVASVTDATYRAEFYDDVARDVREVLAVRAVVRAVPSGSPVGAV
jgi:hypothetical protein